MNPNIAKVKKHLKRARELAARGHSIFKGINLEQAIKKMLSLIHI